MSTTQLTSHVAGLAGENGQLINGVAVGVGDVTRGLSGDQKVWTAEELRAAAASLEGTPVNPLHSEQTVGEVVRAGFDPDRGVLYEAELEDSSLADQAADGHLEVSIEARHADGGTVETDRGEAMLATNIQFTGLSLVQRGAAPSASASAGEAAALSATAIHESLADARLVDVNGTEVDIEPPERVVNAIEAGLDAKEEYADAIGDCGTGVGEDMGRAILDGPTVDLLVDGGDVASNAPATYLASHAEDAPDTDAPPTEWDEETWTDGCGPVQDALWGHYLDWFEGVKADLEAAMEDEAAAEIAGVEFDGTREGELDEPAIPNDDYASHYLYPGETKSESSYPVVDGDGMLRRGNVDAAWSLGARDGRDDEEHDRRLMDLAAAFENPPEWAEDADMSGHADEKANMADVPDEYIFSNPGEAVSKAQEMGLDGAGDEIIHTHGEGEDTDFMPAPSHSELMDMLREMDELMPDPEFSEGDLVRWSTSASPGTGRVAEVASEPGESVSAEGADVTREATEDEAAYKLDDYVGPEAGYDEGVVVKSASEILGPWDDAPEEAEMAATDDAVSPASGQAEASGERTDTQTTTDNAHMSDTEEELRARLSEKDDRIAELETEVEQLEDERADVARAYAEALAAGDSVFDEDELVDKFTVAELADKFDAVEDATLADVEPDVQSGDGDGSQTATLSESEQAEVAELRSAIDDLAGSETRLAEIQREQHAEKIAELTGEDTEDVLAEV